MEKESLIHQALTELARRKTADHTNPYSRIASAIQKRDDRRKPGQLSPSRTIAFVGLLMLALTAVACVYYLINSDIGLQTADKAGLVIHLHQAALPTQFTDLPTQVTTPEGLSQSLNGITVTLDWAYADSSRVDFALIIDGLNLPDGTQIGEYVCRPNVYTLEHIALSLPGVEHYDNNFGQIGKEQSPGAPIILAFEYLPQPDIREYETINLIVDLTIGPCGAKWNAPDSWTGPWSSQTATPPPLVGTYHLSFQVPVSKGLVLMPNQTVVIDDVSMRLETIILDPSFTRVRICPQFLDPNFNLEESDRAFEVSIQMDDQPPVILNTGFDSVESENESCLDVGATVPNIPQPNQVIVRVSEYKLTNGIDYPVDIENTWEFYIDIPK